MAFTLVPTTDMAGGRADGASRGKERAEVDDTDRTEEGNGGTECKWGSGWRHRWTDQ